MKQNKMMRNAMIRVSAKNRTTKHNEQLGVHAGEEICFTKEQIQQILEDWTKTKFFYYYMIEHSADPDNIHYHIVIAFTRTSQAKFSQIKDKFPYGQITNCEYGVKACVQYLVHMNDPAKHQYSWEDVITNSPERLALYKVPGKATLDMKTQDILNKIISGQIREYQINLIPADIYLKHSSKIKAAFEYRQQLLISNPNREVMVVFLQGPAGIGKSTFCKEWAKNKSICLSSSSNDPWQDYKGQTIFVYDDCNFAHTKIEDLLKAWDPHNNTTISARYKNRLFMGDTIFVCSNTPITEWYRYSPMPLRAALLRRISHVLDFDYYPIPENDASAYYTVNELKDTGEVEEYTTDKGFKRYYAVYELRQIGDRHPYDPSKYFNMDSDKKRTEAFIKGLDEM